MRDFFAFRTMITGFVVQIVFVLGLIAIVIGGIGAIANDQPVLGLLVLAFGALYWRIVCELIIVVFRINKSLDTVKTHTAALASTLPGSGGTPASGSAGVEPAPVASNEPVVAASAATATTATLPREGWYADSERPGHKRWWDGTAWGMRDDEQGATSASALETREDSAVLPTTVEPGSQVSPGEANESETGPVRFCENCGAERSPSSRFCTACGQA